MIFIQLQCDDCGRCVPLASKTGHVITPPGWSAEGFPAGAQRYHNLNEDDLYSQRHRCPRCAMAGRS